MVLEGIVTTLNLDESVNISPMGPIVEQTMDVLTLRPYPTSTTYQNLRRSRQGVFHVIDDVELLAQAAIGVVHPTPARLQIPGVKGWILADACRWYAFEVKLIDESEPRVKIVAPVTARGTLRDFFGWNRAKHAVVEAAILATRLNFLPGSEILAEFSRLAPLVDKTGAEPERRAFAFLQNHVRVALNSHLP